MKKLYAAITVLFVLLFVFQACDNKIQSRGKVRNIVVVADSALWSRVDSMVTAKLCPERFTPQPENIFVLNQIPPQNLGRLKRYPQVLFIGTLDMGGTTKTLLDQMLPPQSHARELVESGERFFYEVDEPWSKNQLLGVLVANDEASLVEQFNANGDQVFNAFDEHANLRAEQQVYYREYQKDLTKQLMDSSGWSVNVPLSWFIAIDDPEARVAWLRKMNPQRELFVYWEPVQDPSILSKEWMVDTRNRLSKQYFEGDYIYSDSTVKVVESTVNFLDRYCIKLEGIWQNDSLVAGGPFRSYGFYNEGDGRMYLIDLSVFAPEERKWLYLRQLDAVAKTFKTRNETDKSRSKP